MEEVFDRISEPIDRRLSVGLAKLGLALRSRAWRSGIALRLTPTQGSVLALLLAHPERGLRLSAVAEQLAVSPPTASDAVKILIEKGLIEKGRAEDDRRAVDLRLTPEGEAAARATSAWPDVLQGAYAALSEEEQTALLRLVIKMIRGLQQAGEIPVARMCVSCRYFRPDAYPCAELPHHCAYVDAPFGDRHLRVDCQEHAPASAAQQEAAWLRFSGEIDHC